MPYESLQHHAPTRLFARVSGDLRRRERPLDEPRAHLDAVMGWLARAQRAGQGGGVSAGYHVLRGWDAPYPETTGYLIPTFLRYARLRGDGLWVERARRAGRWLRSVQRPDGAIPGRTRRKEPVVFDTGQVIFGWLSLYRLEGDEEALRAARRAGDWLVAVQEEDGAWRRHEFNGIAHAYDSRVAWALLALAEDSGEAAYRTAAERFLRWLTAQMGDDGWIEHMAFGADEAPFTHTIAYTLEGMWAAAAYCDAELAQRLRTQVRNAMNAIGWRYLGQVGRPQVPGRLAPGWVPQGDYDCLTGDAQLARVALDLARAHPAGDYRDWATRLLTAVARHQDRRPGHAGISGGIAGSDPLWGGYLPGWFPNWAAKFAADAWMDWLGLEEPAAVG